jgi:hypothetical protein
MVTAHLRRLRILVVNQVVVNQVVVATQVAPAITVLAADQIFIDRCTNSIAFMFKLRTYSGDSISNDVR